MLTASQNYAINIFYVFKCLFCHLSNAR